MILPETHEAAVRLAAPIVPLDSVRGPDARQTLEDIGALDQRLAHARPEAVVAAAAERFGDGLVVSTSFGIQAAATLHLASSIVPGIPVVWVDTGYLPPETYRFADTLVRQLDLNLHVFQSPMSPARMEALHGRAWEEGTVEALDRYDQLRKVEPLQRGLQELGATAWISGVRAEQTAHRKTLPRVGRHGGRAKIHPILHWSARDLHGYLKANGLPYHPLFDEGYATVGDWHSSRPVGADDTDERSTRFGGLKQECGIHLSPEEDESLVSSAPGPAGLLNLVPQLELPVDGHGDGAGSGLEGRRSAALCHG
ncbi:MAG: phosphoadenylyl-sulfate reductase [Deltaproteobacteria bacterium]|nr:phosphoadenylyl-sulfate reductase [Deltaproteobacteria bacterium]